MNDPLLASNLRRAAAARRTRVALRDEEFTLTYGDLLDRSAALAHQLRESGVGEGDTVMIKCSNHPLDFVAFLGTWMAFAVAVPIHRTTPPGVIDGIRAKADCRYAVDLLQVGQAHVTLLAPLDPAGSHRGAILAGAALVIFTSGSTGMPKGVVLTHKAFAGKLEQNQKLLMLTEDDVTLLVLNNTFSFGIWMALLTLMHGGTVVARSRFGTRQFVECLIGEGITRTGVVPTMIRATFASLTEHELLDAEKRLRTQGRLRDVVIGGESLSPELSFKLRSFIAPAELHDVYGLTETSTSDFVLSPGDYPAHPGTIGKPAHGVAYRIAQEGQVECPVGVSGELQLRTPYIMAGYINDDDLTASAFIDGWFRTGDLAHSNPDGFVTIVGRLKELIVRGGNKITPLEVERALCGCSGVAAALVIGAPDAVLGQRIHALLVPQIGETIDAAEVRMHLAGKLERFKHPDACYLGFELPTGRTGKIDRGQLLELLLAGSMLSLAGWSH